jgi:hypothetical protein
MNPDNPDQKIASPAKAGVHVTAARDGQDPQVIADT